jgi:hypothetical protein
MFIQIKCVPQRNAVKSFASNYVIPIKRDLYETNGYVYIANGYLREIYQRRAS